MTNTKEYLVGFQSQHQETDTVKLTLRGKLPDWLHGEFLRNGPALFDMKSESVNHWFDGFAMLHRFQFEQSEVHYSCRFLESYAYKRALASGKIESHEFGTRPKQSLFKKLKTLTAVELTDNANVNIATIQGKTLALTEVNQVQIDPKTLHPIGHFSFADNLKGQITTAHPHYDFGRRETLNLLINVSQKSEYIVYNLKDGASQRRVVASIPVDKPSYIHSFAVTKNFVILMEFPLLLDPLQLLFSNKPYIENFKWQPQKGVRFLIVPKESGQRPIVITHDACFAFHHVNAFENDHNIFVDAAVYEDANIIKAFYLKSLNAGNSVPLPTLTRFKLDCSRGTAKSEPLCDSAIEFPRINYQSYNGANYRFAYGVGAIQAGDYFNQLVKIDLEGNDTATWHEEHCYPGEPVFVARHGAVREDDGAILSVILNAEKRSSFLIVIDGQTMQELARAELPFLVNFGLHGTFSESRA